MNRVLGIILFLAAVSAIQMSFFMLVREIYPEFKRRTDKIDIILFSLPFAGFIVVVIAAVRAILRKRS